MKIKTLVAWAWMTAALVSLAQAQTAESCPTIESDQYRIRPWVVETIKLKEVKNYLSPPKRNGRSNHDLKLDDFLGSAAGAAEFTPEILLAVLSDRAQAELRYWMREEVLSNLCEGDQNKRGQSAYFPNTCGYYKDGQSKSITDTVLTDALRDDFRGLPACYIYRKNSRKNDVGYYLSRLVMTMGEQKDPALLLAGLAENPAIKQACSKLGDATCPLYLTGVLAQAVVGFFANNDPGRTTDERLDAVLNRLLYKLKQDGQCDATRFGVDCDNALATVVNLKSRLNGLRAFMEDVDAARNLYADYKKKVLTSSSEELQRWRYALVKSAVEVFLDFGVVYQGWIKGASPDDWKKSFADSQDKAKSDTEKALAGIKRQGVAIVAILEQKKRNAQGGEGANVVVTQEKIKAFLGCASGSDKQCDDKTASVSFSSLSKWKETKEVLGNLQEVRSLLDAIDIRSNQAEEFERLRKIWSACSTSLPNCSVGTTWDQLGRSYYQLLSVMQLTTTLESGDYSGALKTVRYLLGCVHGLDARTDPACQAWNGMVLDEDGVQSAERVLERLDFIVAASQVKTSQDAKAVLDNYGTPTGFWMEKRKRNVLSIGALAGVAGGYETLSGGGASAGSLYGGGFLPVGLDVSWRADAGGVRTKGIFFSIFDLGPMVSTRFNSDASVQSNATVGFSQLISPGIYARWGLWNSPWVWGLGWSHTPALRRMTVNGGTVDGDSSRVLVFFAMDLPLFGF